MMIKKIQIFLTLLIIQLLINTPVMGKSMPINKPFYKVFINTQGLKYRIVVNGFDIRYDKSLSPLKLEIPINQFVKTGENKFELQIVPFNKKGVLSKTDEDYIAIEFRLYTDLNNYVVLSKLSYSAKNLKAGEPYKGSTSEGQYSLINHKFETDNKGEYIVSALEADIKENAYNKTFIRQSVTMKTPFPEWKFLTGDLVPDRKQFKTMDQLVNGLIGAPFKVLEKIHKGLTNKDIDSIMPLFKERNDEMDKAFYYEPGTYEKLLREAFEEDFEKGRILKSLDINKARPMISSGKNIMQLGTGPLIRFHNKSKSIFFKYDIYFRKDGDKWIITR